MTRKNIQSLLTHIDAGDNRFSVQGHRYMVYRDGYTMKDGTETTEPVAVTYSGLYIDEYKRSDIEKMLYATHTI